MTHIEIIAKLDEIIKAASELKTYLLTTSVPPPQPIPPSPFSGGGPGEER